MDKEKQYLMAKLMRGMGGQLGGNSAIGQGLGIAEEELKRRMEEEEREKLAKMAGGQR